MATPPTRDESEEQARSLSFEIEDGRHLPKWIVRDWIVLAVMVGLTLAWNLMAYAWEPGLR